MSGLCVGYSIYYYFSLLKYVLKDIQVDIHLRILVSLGLLFRYEKGVPGFEHTHQVE